VPHFLLCVFQLLWQVKQLARKDAMYPLTAADLNSIWKARLHLKNIEEALPKVLLLIALPLSEEPNGRHPA
jgi:hypothetical protein